MDPLIEAYRSLATPSNAVEVVADHPQRLALLEAMLARDAQLATSMLPELVSSMAHGHYRVREVAASVLARAEPRATVRFLCDAAAVDTPAIRPGDSIHRLDPQN